MLDNKKVERFIQETLTYRYNSYSQPKRLSRIKGKKGTSDCSSLIQKPLEDLGLNTRPGVAVTTRRMGVEGDSRFREIPLKEIERGDIVWYRNDKNGKYFGHVGIYLGNKEVFEAIYAGVNIYKLNRIKWQRAFRIVALEGTPTAPPIVIPFSASGVVRANILNVRASNSVNASKVGQLKNAQKVTITGKVGEWFEINYNNSKAFVSGAYVDVINDKPVENIPVILNGAMIKKGYIVNGVTYIIVNGKEVSVRKAFESMGAKVEWQNNRVQIII